MKRTIIAVLFVSISILCVALWVYLAQERFGEGDFQHLRIGMSLEEVQEVVGCPPGDYRSGQQKQAFVAPSDEVVEIMREQGANYREFVDKMATSYRDPEAVYIRSETWCGSHYGITVFYDAHRIVLGYALFKVHPRQRPMLFFGRFFKRPRKKREEEKG
jgi:hypothetical protein